MGVIKQGIMGGFSGKVGGIVGSSWKGIAVIKAMPLSVSQPNTTKQINAKNKFANTVNVATEILVDVIKPLLDRTAVKMSGYNAFMQINKGCFNQTGMTNYPQMKIARGRLHGGSDLAGSVQ